MRTVVLRWIYENYSFWDLACHACGGRGGWHTSFCSWRSNSYIAVAACRLCGAEQFLKKYRQPGNGNKSIAQSEYEVLRHMDGGVRSEPSFLLPRVYHFAATTYALSMEYLQGESMDERMRRTQDRKDFDECLRLSAAWLRGLHAAPSIHDKTGNDCEALLRQLESNCGSLADQNAMAAQVLARLRANLSRIKDLPVEHVLLHGDFKPSNLICAREGVHGIDVGLRFKNPGLMDAAQFIANVLLNRRSMPAIAGDHEVASILDVFLETYGDNSQPTRDFAAWWLLYFLLSRWQYDLEGWKPSIFIDRIYAVTLADVMAFCDRTASP
jgi:tRNA A-37 threonylcarbamoyl transferase component Bud32